MSNLSKVVELRNEVESLKRKLEEAKDALHAERCRLYEIETGLKVGDLVQGDGDKVYKVAFLSFFIDDPSPWRLEGFRQKKDGSFSERHTNIYKWKKI